MCITSAAFQKYLEPFFCNSGNTQGKTFNAAINLAV